MEKSELINMITQQVLQKLNASNTSSAKANCSGNCNCRIENKSEERWDGIGTVSDFVQAGATRMSVCSPLGSCPDPALASLIDHTLLKPDATYNEVEKLCIEARDNNFMSVCVNSIWVPLAAKILRGTNVKVCTVVGFPLGASPTRVKELETRIAIEEGASEIDMVINIGALKSGDYKTVENDIAGVVRATRGNVISKVILETCLLTKDEIRKASELAIKAGADFVKTSTGFSSGGAKVEDIKIMREVVGKTHGVKASGGIRDHETAMQMVHAGASRIGASASVGIISCSTPAQGKY